ncbi:MAG TPA: hypothetical protein VK463_10330 [Desulfomonilaceae bacterium]|nr:hypothetical protein [Desulfomonilaceae bacterium]
MEPEFRVKCTTCGFANELRIGRIYNRLLCTKCGAEIDTDASSTLNILLEAKPVELKRDTVTVGFRPREEKDWIVCEACGTKAELTSEDVLEIDKGYKCRSCGHTFHISKEAAVKCKSCGA